MSTIIDYLGKLGLSNLETNLYLMLLQSGPITVRELAKKANIGRTTAYPYIDLLLEKGLIMKVVKDSHTFISITSPQESLQQILEQKTQTITSMKDEFPQILKVLQASLSPVREDVDAEMEYYRGIRGVKKIYKDAFEGTELRLYANLSELAILLPDPIDDYMFDNAFLKNPKLKIFEIISDTPDAIIKYELDNTSKNGRYFYKLMPPSIGLTAPGILLYDNKVAIINRGAKVSAVVLHNPVYYINTKKIFDYVWGTLP